MAESNSSESAAERTAVSIPMSEEFKKAFRDWADRNEYKVLSKAGQVAIAKMIGYDLINEPPPKSRNRYGTDEIGLVDREYARLKNSYKSSQQLRWLKDGQKARKDKDKETLDALDNALLRLETNRSWEPENVDGTPDWAKRVEIREKAISLLKESTDPKKKIPADYDDEKLEELRAELPDSE